MRFFCLTILLLKRYFYINFSAFHRIRLNGHLPSKQIDSFFHATKSHPFLITQCKFPCLDIKTFSGVFYAKNNIREYAQKPDDGIVGIGDVFTLQVPARDGFNYLALGLKYGLKGSNGWSRTSPPSPRNRKEPDRTAVRTKQAKRSPIPQVKWI